MEIEDFYHVNRIVRAERKSVQTHLCRYEELQQWTDFLTLAFSFLFLLLHLLVFFLFAIRSLAQFLPLFLFKQYLLDLIIGLETRVSWLFHCASHHLQSLLCHLTCCYLGNFLRLASP